MQFNSMQYAIFLPLVVLLYWRLPYRYRNVLILIASYYFYGSWDVRFLALLGFSTVCDFFTARKVYAATVEKTKKRWFAVTLIVNLGILGFFKYFNFFVDSAVELIEGLGFQANAPSLRVLLPVGISFYTFQTISYTFDVYRGRIKPTNNLLNFATFVAFFPQLVAGPIERAGDLLPQLEKEQPPPTPDRIVSALALILQGLFKKVVIADVAARVVNPVFGDVHTASSINLLAAMFCFAIQLYGDFSGYTDIARGSARLLNIDLMVNFRQPMLSKNPSEFWTRWHISLSNWLLDYLYIPLGGNRGGALKTFRNLFLTMTIGGLWHGASWNFVLWGASHGILLVIHLIWVQLRGPATYNRFTGFFAAARNFTLVTLVTVFFRAQSFSDAMTVFKRIFTLAGPIEYALPVGAAIFFVTLTVAVDQFDIHHGNVSQMIARRPLVMGLLIGVVMLAIFMYAGATPEPFVYFQF
ncbi:MAG: MBOAT family protein [Acidimicrobiia bacterium]|nr:MBOAT family protein [Acidimicrobiia bacterium]MBP8180747.1 MBOAT family protein [Acidimicrobiia bacterium]